MVMQVCIRITCVSWAIGGTISSSGLVCHWTTMLEADAAEPETLNDFGNQSNDH
jgi:hypothetical protein